MDKRRKNRSNPIDDYIEWTNHRYTPGHYTGGRISPFLRPTSPRARRRMGLGLLWTSAFSGLVMVVSYLDNGLSGLLMPIVFVLLTALAGIKMLRQGRPKSGA